jgi:histidinol-phosphate aminotransferase
MRLALADLRTRDEPPDTLALWRSGTPALEIVMSQDHIDRLLRPDIAALEAYTPILPVDVLARRLGLPASKIVKLDANENPYGCSLRVQEALASFDRYHLYPDPNQGALREALAHYTGAPPDRILPGAGSDELIDLLIMAFVSPGDEVIICPPTFGMYKTRTEVFGGRVVSVPRAAGFAIDPEAIAAAVTPRTKLIFLASPNNPTGNPVSRQHIVRLLGLGPIVVVDEAYFEFYGQTVVPLVSEFDHLVVLRTFSKWAGLAGLRLGYGIFPAGIIKHLWKIKQPYNVNVAAQVAALATLEDRAAVEATLRRIKTERGRLYRQLRKLLLLQPYDSEANFLLCKVRLGEAKALKEALEAQGIFIRHYSSPDLRDYVRVSVGRPEDTDALLAALLAYTARALPASADPAR